MLKPQVPRYLRGCKGFLVALNESAARYTVCLYVHNLSIVMCAAELFQLGMDVMKNSLQIWRAILQC